MLPVTTTTVDIDRPVAASDPDDAPTLTRQFTALPAHVSSPTGNSLVGGGQQEQVDAVLYVDLTDPALDAGDIITDCVTGDTWRVTWARRRRGLGLDHQAAGLRAVKGATLNG